MQGIILWGVMTTWLSSGLALLQLQLLGSVPVPSIIYKVLLLTLLLMIFFARLLQPNSVITANADQMRYLSIWMGSLLINFCFIDLFSPFPIIQNLFSVIVLFFYGIILFMLSVLGFRFHNLSSRQYKPPVKNLRAIYIIAMTIILVGALQGFFDFEINTAEDDYLLTKSLFFLGQELRAHSIFTSGFAFGEFAGFFMLYSFLKIGEARTPLNKLMYVSSTAISLVACWYTYTRNVYLLVLIAAIGLALFHLKFRASILQIFSWLLVFAFLGLFFFLQLSDTSDGITNASSMVARFAHWNRALDMWSDAPFASKIFGLGLLQNDRFDYGVELVFDNIYIAVLMFGGVFGLVCFMAFFIKTQAVIFEVLKSASSQSFARSVAAFWFAAPVSASLNTQVNVPLTLACLLLIYCGRLRVGSSLQG